MSETLKMIVHELPRTMGEIDHELLLSDLKIALKEVDKLEQQLTQARREGWEQAKMKAVIALGGCNTVEECWDAIAAMEYGRNDNES